MKKDQFIDECADLVEQFFPKGKTKMRGEAMVLVAAIVMLLVKNGVIEE